MTGILGFFSGFFVILLLHLLQVGLYYWLAEYGRRSGLIPDFAMMYLVFGVLQVVYVIPAMIYAYGHWNMAVFWGMTVCVSLTLVMQLWVWFIFAGSTFS
jgi:hypothetical protein